MEPVIRINEKKCTLCYACMRKCPVKAIGMPNENLCPEIISERCIGCGMCIQSCSYGAVDYMNSVDDVMHILKTKMMKIALVDPAIAGEFGEISDVRKFIKMLRELGFNKVHDVAFGVDLVAKKYIELYGNFKGKYYISSHDPVVVAYIEKYHTNLIHNLVPVVSPMIAMAKVVRKLYGNDIHVVYIGPNIACKSEKLRFEDDSKIDAVITFRELRSLFQNAKLDESNLEFSDFDAPHGFKGALYPLPTGLYQAMDAGDNVLTSNILNVDGLTDGMLAISEFEENIETIGRHFLVTLGSQLIGPGTTDKVRKFKRQALVINYTNKRIQNFYRYEWDQNIRIYGNLGLKRGFVADNQALPIPTEVRIQEILLKLNVTEEISHRGCAACGYGSCYDFAVAAAQGLTTVNMCITYAQRNQLESIAALKAANEKLENIQEALQKSELEARHGKRVAEEANETVTTMLHKLRAGVLILDADLKIVHCNQTLINMLGDDVVEINKIIPGMKGADVKKILPVNFYTLFRYVLNSKEDIPNKDIVFNDTLLNISIFQIKPKSIIGAVFRDLHVPVVQREEVIHRVTEVIDKNLEMVQKIGFLLGEGAAETEKMLHSIIESFRNRESPYTDK